MSDYLVIYSSTTGFTEKYAQWIAEDLACETVKLSDLEPAQLKSAKTIIYGGPVHAGWVVGLNKFLRRSDRQKSQNVFVFAVGLAKANSADAARYRTANLKDENRKIPWFYFQGGVDIDRVKWPVNVVLKSIVLSDAEAKQKEALKAGMPDEEQGNPLKQDHSDRAAIQSLVEAVKAIA
ncbi:MAG TPA: flavodoxin domain-containing protein [Anaerolineaceae bacterium]|nr:flavodoxin domain-containing protein [Anaerolineaceae bacterium]